MKCLSVTPPPGERSILGGHNSQIACMDHTSSVRRPNGGSGDARSRKRRILREKAQAKAGRDRSASRHSARLGTRYRCPLEEEPLQAYLIGQGVTAVRCRRRRSFRIRRQSATCEGYRRRRKAGCDPMRRPSRGSSVRRGPKGLRKIPKPLRSM